MSETLSDTEKWFGDLLESFKDDPEFIAEMKLLEEEERRWIEEHGKQAIS